MASISETVRERKGEHILFFSQCREYAQHGRDLTADYTFTELGLDTIIRDTRVILHSVELHTCSQVEGVA